MNVNKIFDFFVENNISGANFHEFCIKYLKTDFVNASYDVGKETKQLNNLVSVQTLVYKYSAKGTVKLLLCGSIARKIKNKVSNVECFTIIHPTAQLKNEISKLEQWAFFNFEGLKYTHSKELREKFLNV